MEKKYKYKNILEQYDLNFRIKVSSRVREQKLI